jgi:hypothetical protein
MTFRSNAALLLAALAACPACSSTYQPMPGPRISIVQEAGKPMLARAGKRYDIGMFGGGVVEAVEGVPEAEEHAESFRNRNIAAFAMAIGGAAFTIGGVSLLASGAHANETVSEAGIVTGSLLASSGLALVFASMFTALSAQPRLWDAINVYNDTVSPMPMPMPMWTPMPPPNWTPPPAPSAAPLGEPPPPPPIAPLREPIYQ